jgi:7-carboxy-7-deazaguanine synthase
MTKRPAVLTISEVFGITIQGEGPMIGRPTVFVRAGGCDYQHCSWCDTLYAVLPEHRREWERLSTDAVLDRVRALSGPCLVTLSGGNPAIQPFGELVAAGHAQGYTFTCETQGSVVAPWFADLDHLVLSPKPPSSGMETDWSRLDDGVAVALAGGTDTALKIVVFDDADYAYARSVHRRYPDLPLYLQVGNPDPPAADGGGTGIDVAGSLARLRWLMDRVCSDRWHEARVLPQLHALVFGNARGT